MPTLFPWKRLGHPSHTGFSTKKRAMKTNLSPCKSSTVPLQSDADDIEGQQHGDDMRTSDAGVSSDEPSTTVQRSATSGLLPGKGNIKPSICGMMWSGTSEQSTSNHGMIGTSEPGGISELSTSGIVWRGSSDRCTNEIVWNEVESCSDHGEMSISSDVMPLSDVSVTSNFVQAQFDASNVTHNVSDIPVDALVGCAVILNSVDREVQAENDNTYGNVLLHRIDALETQNELLKCQLINVTFNLDRFSNNDYMEK